MAKRLSRRAKRVYTASVIIIAFLAITTIAVILVVQNVSRVKYEIVFTKDAYLDPSMGGLFGLSEEQKTERHDKYCIYSGEISGDNYGRQAEKILKRLVEEKAYSSFQAFIVNDRSVCQTARKVNSGTDSFALNNVETLYEMVAYSTVGTDYISFFPVNNTDTPVGVALEVLADRMNDPQMREHAKDFAESIVAVFTKLGKYSERTTVEFYPFYWGYNEQYKRRLTFSKYAEARAETATYENGKLKSGGKP